MKLNDIVTAVKRKLADSTGLPVYSEETFAKAKQPCYFVRLVAPEIENVLNDRLYFISAVISVVYIPEDDERKVNSMLTDVSHMLFFLLNYIEVDGRLIRGGNMDAQRADGDVLSFSVTYELYARLISSDEAVRMEELEFSVNGLNILKDDSNE